MGQSAGHRPDIGRSRPRSAGYRPISTGTRRDIVHHTFYLMKQEFLQIWILCRLWENYQIETTESLELDCVSRLVCELLYRFKLMWFRSLVCQNRFIARCATSFATPFQNSSTYCL